MACSDDISRDPFAGDVADSEGDTVVIEGEIIKSIASDLEGTDHLAEDIDRGVIGWRRGNERELDVTGQHDLVLEALLFDGRLEEFGVLQHQRQLLGKRGQQFRVGAAVHETRLFFTEQDDTEKLVVRHDRHAYGEAGQADHPLRFTVQAGAFPRRIEKLHLERRDVARKVAAQERLQRNRLRYFRRAFSFAPEQKELTSFAVCIDRDPRRLEQAFYAPDERLEYFAGVELPGELTVELEHLLPVGVHSAVEQTVDETLNAGARRRERDGEDENGDRCKYVLSDVQLPHDKTPRRRHQYVVHGDDDAGKHGVHEPPPHHVVQFYRAVLEDRVRESRGHETQAENAQKLEEVVFARRHLPDGQRDDKREHADKRSRGNDPQLLLLCARRRPVGPEEQNQRSHEIGGEVRPRNGDYNVDQTGVDQVEVEAADDDGRRHDIDRHRDRVKRRETPTALRDGTTTRSPGKYEKEMQEHGGKGEHGRVVKQLAGQLQGRVGDRRPVREKKREQGAVDREERPEEVGAPQVYPRPAHEK